MSAKGVRVTDRSYYHAAHAIQFARMENSVFFQLDRLVERIEQKGHAMIDPIEYGELRGAVTALQTQMSDIKHRQSTMDAKIDLVLTQLSEARGGWRILMLVGGAAGSLGAGLSWVWQTFKGSL